MDATLRIKNLSIALEALSRIADGELDSACWGIKEILKSEIQGIREEKEKENQWPQQGPARACTTNTDDIPF